MSRMAASPSLSIVFLTVMAVAVIYIVVVLPNDLTVTEVFGAGSSSRDSSNQVQAEPVDLRMFMGIVTVPSAYERRALLRLAYSLQPRPVRAIVDVRFVLCTIDKEEDRILVSLEIIAYGDILVINCTENMNDGKTYAYFSAVPRLFAAAPYDYVGKADDDTYFRVAALAESLRGKARRDVYYGFLTPCHSQPEKQFMSGMGYVVSWDVVEWIAATPELRDDHHKWEDEDFGGWLHKGGKYKNVYNEEPRMYGYWDREMNIGEACDRHQLMVDTVAVHKLKDRLKWARTLYFFNATQGLEPSEFYQVDLQNDIYKV